MAISDINLQVKTEQGTGFSGKETESSDKASGLSFLTSLTQASEAANAQAKSDAGADSVDETKAISTSEEPKSDAKPGDESTAADAKAATATTSSEQQSKTSPDVRNEAVTKEQSDELALVEDEENSLLSQINAAQAMSTRVNKLIENNDVSPVVVDKKPSPIDTITPVIPSPMTDVAQTDDSKADAEGDNSIASLLHKSKVATAVDSQLKAMGDLPPKDSISPVIDSPLTDKGKLGVSAVNTPDTKPQVSNLNNATEQTGGKKADVELDALLKSTQKQQTADLEGKTSEVSSKQTQSHVDKSAASIIDKKVTDNSIVGLFAKVQSGDGEAVSEFAKGLSLTSEQQKQLEQQINQLKADNKLSADEVATVKSLLSELSNSKSAAQSPVSQFAVEQDIANENQAKQVTKLADNKALDNKLPTGVEKQITALTKDEQQALLNKVNTQLQTLTPGTAQYEKLSAAQTLLTESINAPA